VGSGVKRLVQRNIDVQIAVSAIHLGMSEYEIGNIAGGNIIDV
jgi:hypothetical protein